MIAFTLFGCKVEFHPRSFAEFVGLVLVVDVLLLVLLARPFRLVEELVFSVAIVALIELSAAAHEFGHALAARAAGMRIERIVLGDRCRIVVDDTERLTPRWGILVSLAGIAVDVLLLVPLYMVLVAVRPGGVTGAVLAWWVIWLAFSFGNLIPVANSDGAKALFFFRKLRASQNLS